MSFVKNSNNILAFNQGNLTEDSRFNDNSQITNLEKIKFCLFAIEDAKKIRYTYRRNFYNTDYTMDMMKNKFSQDLNIFNFIKQKRQEIDEIHFNHFENYKLF